MRTAELMTLMIAAAVENRPYTHGKTDEAEAKQIFALSAKHDVAHIVAAVIDLPKDSEIQKVFYKHKLTAIYRREQLNSEEARICTTLEEAGIDYIALKGAVIRKLYPEEWMRTSCDIDILVKESELENAITQIVEKLSYTDLGRDFHDHHLKSPSGVHLELHFSIAENDDRLDKVLNRVWQYAVCESGHKYLLTNEFLIFQTIAHAQYHFISGGCGVRPLIDLWLLENKLEFSQDELDKLLAESGSERFYSAIKSLISVWFEGQTHTELTEKTEKYILAGGVFGTKANRAATGKYKKGGKSKYIISRIFLPKSDLVIAYPKLKDHPARLPYYEVKRWFSLLSKNKLSDAKSEFESSEDVSEMLKELGF